MPSSSSIFPVGLGLSDIYALSESAHSTLLSPLSLDMYFSPIPSLILPDNFIMTPYITSIPSSYFLSLLNREFELSNVLSGVSKLSVTEYS